MSVNNNYRYKLNQVPTDGYINIPVQITFDNLGRQDGIQEFENNTIEDIINPISDFEVTRFAHAIWGLNSETNINYEFYFYNGGVDVTATTNDSSWIIDYEASDFTNSEIYYFANSFKGSFFKLDFYDKNTTEDQKILFSIILPTQQGLLEDGTVGPPLNPTPVKVKRPKYILDYVGADKEGFYLYWLKNTTYMNQTEFYMSAKFFNAKQGVFYRMMNQSQGNLIEKFNFNKSLLFYYKCIIDYDTYEYKVYIEDSTGALSRVGTPTDPIKWYEYVNP